MAWESWLGRDGERIWFKLRRIRAFFHDRNFGTNYLASSSFLPIGGGASSSRFRRVMAPPRHGRPPPLWRSQATIPVVTTKIQPRLMCACRPLICSDTIRQRAQNQLTPLAPPVFLAKVLVLFVGVVCRCSCGALSCTRRVQPRTMNSSKTPVRGH